MRKSMLLCLVSLFIISCVTAPAEKLQKQEVLDIPGMSKEQIFNNSNQWIAEKFGSANVVIQYKDLKEGKIIGKIITPVNKFMVTYNFNTTLLIDIKDQKSRLSFESSDVTIVVSGEAPTTRPIYGQSEAEMAQDSFKPVKESYLNYMLGKAKKDDNW